MNRMSNATAERLPHGSLTSGIGLCLIGVGTAVLAGWTFDLPVLTGLFGDITMKANAALSLLAAGIALFLLTSHRQAAQTLGQVGALLAGVLGALTLSEHVVGW